MARFRCFLFWLVLLAPASVFAEVLVLIQGYLGDGESWRSAGIVQVLETGGWSDGGNLKLVRNGVAGATKSRGNGRRVYTLSLATEAPLVVQGRQLAAYMSYLGQRHPGESLVLVGHSAGGVLGRLYMVEYPDAGVAALVTIASPHLGTESAELGVLAGRSPLGWFAPFVGGQTLNRSQGLYQDLVRERPGSLLFWLNRQEHPPAHYVSVIRRDDTPLGLGDLVVPSWSQDMNGTYALRGRSRTLVVPGGHGLRREDGQLLLQILRRLHTT